MKIYVYIPGREIVEVDVDKNIRVRDFKRKLMEITRDPLDFNDFLLFEKERLDDYGYLEEYNIKDGSEIYLRPDLKYRSRISFENSNFSTNICAVNKRENIGGTYYYKIKGSNEGTVWGDHIYTDDSNIAKAAVLEGCPLGEEIIVGIQMIEGKSSYSSANKNGVSSLTYGSWPASFIFTYLQI